jgi:hypothetical protein
MILSIMQPAYLPWLGYFNRLLLSDNHIILDHVSIDANSKTKFANRNKIRTKHGWIWLTVPIVTKGLHGRTALNTLQIAAGSANWAAKTWKSIEANYRKAPFFGDYAPAFESVYREPGRLLLDLNLRITNLLLRAFGMQPIMMLSSSMEIGKTKDDLILSLCHQVGADVYLSGPFGRDYLCSKKFHDGGVELRYHDYRHPQYRQVYPGFEPFMSAIDLLFNYGPEASQVLSRAGTLVKE